jgi:predicted amino acid-binding ACT domain protein
MYVVRNTFTAKPGMSSKLAKLVKEVMADLVTVKFRVMTDYIGPMNTVVLEMEVADLAEWEKQFKEYGSRADIQQRMKAYTDMYETGTRTVYQMV